MSHLEHVNITVSDPKSTAQLLIDLFGWHIRWEGASMNGVGYTCHVGTKDSYLAVYSGSTGNPVQSKEDSYTTRAGLNHIGVVVDDLDATEAKVKELGFKTFSHADYEPGRRFYFNAHDGIEIEVVNYD